MYAGYSKSWTEGSDNCNTASNSNTKTRGSSHGWSKSTTNSRTHSHSTDIGWSRSDTATDEWQDTFANEQTHTQSATRDITQSECVQQPK